MAKVLLNFVRVFVHLLNMFFAGCFMDNWVRAYSPENMFLGIGTLATVVLLLMCVGSSLFIQYGFDD